MTADDRDRLLDYALSVADKSDIDWDTDSAKTIGLRKQLDQLRIVARLARAFDSKTDDPEMENHQSTFDLASHEQDDSLFQWGHLRVLELIGSGGFGEVYRAYDPVLDRQVALKLRRSSSQTDTLKNKAYIEEARRLARVRQANVLAVYGADLFDERVGLWSEYLSGDTLAAKLQSKTEFRATEIQDIALGLCRALTAVHEAGLVHGDVKASNVMIEKDGRVVLMDFGSGSQIDRREADRPSDTIYGTPLVMAPELFSGEPLSPPCDMYSLGVLLFRLISGRFPVEADNVPEIVDYHASAPRPTLGACGSQVPKPVMGLVEKMLEPKPEDRPSAHESRETLAWITEIPRRRAKRAAIATVVTALTVGCFAFMFGFFSARSAENATRLAYERETTVNDFLFNTFASASTAKEGKDAKIVDVLRIAELRIENEFNKSPVTKAALYYTIGNTYRSLGEYETASDMLRRSLETFSEILGETHEATLRTRLALALNKKSVGDPDAEREFRAVVAASDSHLGPEHEVSVGARARLAGLLIDRGKFEEAESLLTRALALRQGEVWVDDEERHLVLLDLGNLYKAQGDYRQAEKPLEEVVEYYSSRNHSGHVNCVAARALLANMYARQGDLAAAERVYRQELASCLDLLGTRHSNTVACINNLANVLFEQGKYDEAAHFARWALDLTRQNLGDQHQHTLVAMGNLANVVREQGDLEEAERLLRKTVASFHRSLGPEHPQALMYTYNLAELLNVQGNYRQAEELSRKTWETQKKVMGEEHHFTLESLDNLGVSLRHLGRLEESETIHRDVLASKKKVLGDRNPYTLITYHNLATVLLERRKLKEAETLFRQVVSIRTDVLGAHHPATRQSLRGLIQTLETSGANQEAEGLSKSLAHPKR